MTPVALRLQGRIGAGEPFSAAAVRAALAKAAGAPVVAHIETNGGVITEALAIAEALAGYGHVRCAVAVRCHSAGLVVFAAGTTRIARQSATFLCHRACVDDCHADGADTTWLEAMATRLDLAEGRVVKFLSRRLGLPAAGIATMLARDRTLTAEQLSSAGWCTVWHHGFDRFAQWPGAGG